MHFSVLPVTPFLFCGGGSYPSAVDPLPNWAIDQNKNNFSVSPNIHCFPSKSLLKTEFNLYKVTLTSYMILSKCPKVWKKELILCLIFISPVNMFYNNAGLSDWPEILRSKYKMNIFTNVLSLQKCISLFAFFQFYSVRYRDGKVNFRQVLFLSFFFFFFFFCWLLLGPMVWPRLGDLFVFQNSW